MKRIIIAKKYSVHTDERIELDRFPDSCPICHHKITPYCVYASQTKDTYHNQAVEIVFECTNHQCRHLFISYYTSYDGSTFYFSSSAPLTIQPSSFSSEIKEASPKFVEIYNECVTAEAKGLPNLLGAGLRKALEFLIKDFLIKENPKEKELIEKTLLGSCIDKYVADENIKQCAKRAAWLGNDQSHYCMVWKDKDISDLKNLIKLTMNWIENQILTQKYIQEMPEKTKETV